MLKAVLIDDEEIALDVLEIKLLEAGGVTVEARFCRVDEAFAYLAEHDPDLIFLDIDMPGMNGLEAAKRLSREDFKATIIFVTAYHEYAVDAFDVNAFGYLLKPVSSEKLAMTLKRYESNRFKSNAVQDKPSAVGDKQVAEPSLYLKVLGSMELYGKDRGLLKWRTKKAKELFIYLWHHEGVPVQRDRIMDDLWPELQFDKAQSLFHTTLYHLRNTVKNAGMSNTVMFGDEKYWMLTDRIASDVDQLKQWLNATIVAPDGIREMTKLYRGDYLEMEYYGWAGERRTELREAYLIALKRHLQLAGQAEKVLILRKMIALEPYTEHYYRLLMRELQEIGDLVAVQALNEQIVQRFKGELGLDFNIDQ